MVAQAATPLWDKQKNSPSGKVADGMIVRWFKGRKQYRIQNQLCHVNGGEKENLYICTGTEKPRRRKNLL